MRRTQVVLALFVFLFATPLITGLLTTIGWDTIFGTLGLVLSGSIVVGLVVRHRHRRQNEKKNTNRQRRGDERPQGTKQSDDEGEGDGFWSAIPNRQYNGRFAEAGGLTRSEQSDAIEKVQTDAQEIERNQR